MVYGYATTDSLDSQGEIITKEAIKKAWEDYMKFANVREMHQPSAVGVTKEYEHDEKGTKIGVKVVDDRAWKFVQEGVYKGFSIGGRILEKIENTITEIVLAEISLVDRPANPDAVFEVIKMDDSAIKALQTLKKEQQLMDLTAILQKDPASLSVEEKQYLRDNVDQLTDEHKEHFAEALNETPAEPAPEGETPAEETPAETPAEETPAEETPADPAPEAPAEETPAAPEGGDAPEGETPKESADTPVSTKKDARGVITLSDVLAHMEYIKDYFASNGKSTKNLEAAISDVMKAVQDEASQKMNTPEGMQKMMGESLTKVLEDLGVTKMVSEFETVKGDVESMKGTRVAKRPTTATPVEKGFENADGAGKSATELRKELATIEADIQKFADEAKSAPSHKAAEIQTKSDELFTKHRDKQREINAAMAAGNF